MSQYRTFLFQAFEKTMGFSPWMPCTSRCRTSPVLNSTGKRTYGNKLVDPARGGGEYRGLKALGSLSKDLKKKVLSASFLLVGILGLLVFAAFLYLSGAASFFRRSLNSSLCLIAKDRLCNKLMNLSVPTAILNQDLKREDSAFDIFTQRVVLVKLARQELWVWTIDGLIKKYQLTNKTTYGIAVPVSKEEVARELYSDYLDAEKLRLVNNTAHFTGEDKGKMMLVESPPGQLRYDEFSQLTGSGNLLKIVYNENTRELIGILLLDFKRI